MLDHQVENDLVEVRAPVSGIALLDANDPIFRFFL